MRLEQTFCTIGNLLCGKEPDSNSAPPDSGTRIGEAPDCYTNVEMDCPWLSRIRRHRARVCAIVALVATTTIVSAQVSNEPEVPAGEMVRAAVANELVAANNTAIKFLFRSRKQTPKGVQNRIYVEANEALASALYGMNDKTLTPQQQRVEIDHLNWLTSDRDQLRRKQAREKEDEERTLRIVRALPDAFLYEYAGTENGETGVGKVGDELARLKYRPNPSYSPPSRLEQVLTGMEGYLLIDKVARRIARIDGTLFKDVTFGWGIFGRLDKGGSFRVQQGDSGEGNWVITQMTLKMAGKILLFKSLNLNSDEVFSDFRRLPEDLPFAQAVEILRTEQEKLAQNFVPPRSADSKTTPQ